MADEFEAGVHEAEKELLEVLLDPILKIDGGCPDCIAGFLEKANSALEAYGYDLKLEGTKDASGNFKSITVETSFPSFDES